MAAAGVASRRACEDLISSGVVTVNGEVVKEQGTLVHPGGCVGVCCLLVHVCGCVQVRVGVLVFWGGEGGGRR